VIFLIDGFNLYHSILDIQYHHPDIHVKWLNIYNFCFSFLHIINTKASLEKIYYFSAYATHLNDHDTIKRHSNYIDCLKSTGIEPILGRFKPKIVNCPYCKKGFEKHEEKETDVAIAIKLIEVLAKNECDIVVLVTGDTDVIPAINTAKSLFQNKSVLCAFPFGRKNKELQNVAPQSFKIGINSYINNQFPNPVLLRNQTQLYKPSTW
jgi:uncharacterized LabA/DUF88 family protein